VLIFRPSQKLNARIKAGSLPALPTSDDPYSDWSAHLFVADRTQYILLSNTRSLYSTVFYAGGITDDRRFIGRALDNLRESLEDAGQAFAYHRFIAPEGGTVQFARASGRAVTGSMNELVVHAKHLLAGGELSPFDAGDRLNDVLLSAIGTGGKKRYMTPREAFRSMAVDPGSDGA
jgi:hypothetical protein